MRHVYRLLLLSAISLSTFAQVPANTAWVRIVHAASDAPSVDILVDGNLAFQGLPFRGYTDYTPVPPGTHTVAINVSGTSTTVLGGPISLSGGSAYTFLAFGKVASGSLTIVGVGDDVSAPSNDSVKVRIIHGASTAPSVDVYATAPFAPLATALLSNVPFEAASDYLTVPAGTYHARVTPTGTKTVAIDSGRLRLPGASVRTIVAIDPAKEGPGFEFLVLPDVN